MPAAGGIAMEHSLGSLIDFNPMSIQFVNSKIVERKKLIK
jgi:hypothetical protein